jgi:hypothetical protein
MLISNSAVFGTQLAQMNTIGIHINRCFLLLKSHLYKHIEGNAMMQLSKGEDRESSKSSVEKHGKWPCM